MTIKTLDIDPNQTVPVHTKTTTDHDPFIPDTGVPNPVEPPSPQIFDPEDVNLAPVVLNAVNLNNLIGDDIVVDVTFLMSDEDSEIDHTTLHMVGVLGNTKVIDGVGIWTLDRGIDVFRFRPEGKYAGLVPNLLYAVKDIQGVESNHGVISVGYVQANSQLPVIEHKQLYERDMDTVQYFNTLLNATDEDGHIIVSSVNIVGSSTRGAELTSTGQGTWKVDTSTGVISFHPVAGFTGTVAPILVNVLDNDGNQSENATFQLTYAVPIIKPAVANDTNLELEPNQVYSANALAASIEGTYPIDPLTLQFVGTSLPFDSLPIPSQGVWAIKAGGIIQFTPYTDFIGSVTPVQYYVRDTEHNRSNVGAVFLKYGDVANTPPMTDPFTVFNIPWSTSYSFAVYAAATDKEGTVDINSVKILGGTNDKSVTVPEGIWSVESVTGSIRFTPNPLFNGGTVTPVFYTIADDKGLESIAKQLNISYQDRPNTAPRVSDFQKLNQTRDQPVHYDLVTGLSDDENDVDVKTLQIIGTDLAGQSLVVANIGVWSIDVVVGKIIFTPHTELGNERVPSIGYQVQDSRGLRSNVGVLRLSFEPLFNEAPVVQNLISLNNAINSVVKFNVWLQATDDQEVMRNSISLGGHSEGAAHRAFDGLWVSESSTGNVAFYPDAGKQGVLPTISYTMRDNKGLLSNVGTLAVGYLESEVVNLAPIVQSKAFSGLLRGNPYTYNVLADAVDNDGLLDYSTLKFIGTAGIGQSLIVDGIGTWTIDSRSNGEITFTPLSTFNYGEDIPPLLFTVRDDKGLESNTGAIAIAFTAALGTAPRVIDKFALNLAVGSLIGINVLSDSLDVDGDMNKDSLQFAGTSGAGESLITAQGIWSILSQGVALFTPNNNFAGNVELLNFTVKDSAGNTSNVGNVACSYKEAMAGNVIPTAEDITSMDNVFGSIIKIPMGSHVNDPDGALNPASLQFVGTVYADNLSYVFGIGRWEVKHELAEIWFTPDTSLGATAIPPIMYFIRDFKNDASLTATIRVGYSVGSANLPPIAQNQSKTNLVIGSVATFEIGSLTSDPDGSIDLSSLVMKNSEGREVSDIIEAGKGTWTHTTTQVIFTPVAGFFGSTGKVYYYVKDNEGLLSNRGELECTYIEGEPVDNVAPVAHNVIFENVAKDNVQYFDVTSVATDSDGTIDINSVVIATGSGSGVWSKEGTRIKFAPSSGFLGTASNTFTVIDDDGAISNTGSVRVTYTTVTGADVGVNTNWLSRWDSPTQLVNLVRSGERWRTVTGTADIRHMTILNGVGFEAISALSDEVVDKSGNYTLVWEGSGQVGIGFFNSAMDTSILSYSGVGTHTFNVPVSEGVLSVMFKGASLTKLIICRTEHLAQLQAGNEWHPDYIALLQNLGAKVVRPMDMLNVNHSAAESYAALPTVASLTWHWGLPHEMVCDLAQRANVDMHITLPNRMSPAGAKLIGGIYKDNFPRSRKLYVEVGNEFWNNAGVFSAGFRWGTHIPQVKADAVLVGNITTITNHGLSVGDKVAGWYSEDQWLNQYERAFGSANTAVPDNTFEHYWLLTRGLPVDVLEVLDTNRVKLGNGATIPNSGLAVGLKIANYIDNYSFPELGGYVADIIEGFMDNAFPSDLVTKVFGAPAYNAGWANEAIGGQQARYDSFAVAPYYYSKVLSGEIVVSSGSVTLKAISTALPSDIGEGEFPVYVAIYPVGAVPSIRDVVNGEGAVYFNEYRQNSALIGSTYTTVGTFNTGTVGTRYVAIFATHRAQEVSAECHAEFTYGTAGTTKCYEDNERMYEREMLTLETATKVMENSSSVAASLGLNIMTYEAGAHLLVNNLPESMAEYMRLYHRTDYMEKVTKAYCTKMASTGCKIVNWYKLAARIRLFGSGNTYSMFGLWDGLSSPNVDGRYRGFSSFGGLIPKLTPPTMGGSTAISIGSSPTSSQHVYDFSVGATSGTSFKLLGTEGANQFTVTPAGKLYLTNPSQYNYATAVVHRLGVLQTGSGITNAKVFDVVIGGGGAIGAPVFTDESGFSVAVGATDAFTSRASSISGVNYYLDGGADAALFTVALSSGEVSFITGATLGVKHLTIKVIDKVDSSKFHSKDYTVTVSAGSGAKAPVWNAPFTINVASGTGEFFTPSVTVDSGGSNGIAFYTLLSSQTGISHHGGNGTVSGASVPDGTYTVTLKVTDYYEEYSTQDYTVIVGTGGSTGGDGVPVITSASAITMASGTTTVGTATATGGSIVWSLEAGYGNNNLVTIGSSTGVVTANSAVADGTYSIKLIATNTHGSISKVISITASSGGGDGHFTWTPPFTFNVGGSDTTWHTPIVTGDTTLFFQKMSGSSYIGFNGGTGEMHPNNPPVPDGSYPCVIRAFDYNGLTSDQTYTFIVGSGGGGSTDTVPVITSPSNVSITEPNTGIGTVTATGGNITYGLASNASLGADNGLVNIDSSTGVVTSKNATSVGTYKLYISATNTAGVGYKGITVTVASSSTETMPVFSSASSVTITAPNTPIIGLLASGGGVTYSKASGGTHNSLVSVSTSGIVRTLNASTAGTYSIKVQATNSVGSTTQTITVTVNVGSGGGTGGVWSTPYSFSHPVNTFDLATVTPTYASGGGFMSRVSGDSILVFNGSTGAIQSAGGVISAGTYTITVRANDYNGVNTDQTYTFIIGSGGGGSTNTLPVFTSPSTVTVTEPTTSLGTLSANGGGITFGLAAGGTNNSLVSVSGSGVVTTNSASTAGTYSIKVQATNDIGTTTQTIAVTVNAGAVTPPPSTGGVWSTPYTFNVGVNTFSLGSAVATYASGGGFMSVVSVDSPLVFNGTTGAIESAGSVIGVGTYNLTVRANDYNGTNTDQTYTVVVS